MTNDELEGGLGKLILSPTLLLNEEICRKNIKAMQEKAKASDLCLRPHFKTHVSKEIGDLFKEVGTSKITVSSLDMACYFEEDGWDDITLAFPVNIREIERINHLASRIKLHLVVENIEAIQYLSGHLKNSVFIRIKIDAGYGRTGVRYSEIEKIEELIIAIKKSNHLIFEGFLSHAGNSYEAQEKEEINTVHIELKERLLSLKKQLKEKYPEISLSIGDTPICSVVEDLSWADEIRPGNYVFYDVMQAFIGSCEYEDIAVAMACPIVAKHEEGNRLIIHGGAVHFARDFLIHPSTGKPFYGWVVSLDEGCIGEPDFWSHVSKLSQEHGTLSVTDEVFEKYRVGDIIGVLPIHSCMTANLMGEYLTFKGKRISRM